MEILEILGNSWMELANEHVASVEKPVYLESSFEEDWAARLEDAVVVHWVAPDNSGYFLICF